MVRLIPFVSHTHHSPLPPAEVLRRVGRLAVPDGWRWPAAGPAAAPPFRGRVWAGGTFRLDRCFDNGRVMGSARVWGRVRPAAGGAGSTVRLRYGLHPSMLAFASVWMSGVCVGMAASGAQLLGSPMAGAFSLIPFGMFVFGLFLFNAPFVGDVAGLRPLLEPALLLEAPGNAAAAAAPPETPPAAPPEPPAAPPGAWPRR